MKKVRDILLIALINCGFNCFGQAALQFGAPEWDFGTICEESGPIAHTFEATNRSEHPEVILEVGTSCGCTKPEFSRRPVLPGETAAVAVTFNPAGQSGSIDRTLTVYGSESRPIARLRIKGRVEPRARTIEERYPIAAGRGIRLTNNYLPFERLPHGRTTEAAIGIANNSDAPQTVRLVGEEQSGLLAVEAPQILQPGEEAQVRIAYRIPADCERYGTITDILRVDAGERRPEVRITLRGIVVDAPQPADAAAPAVRLSSGAIRLGDMKRKAGTRFGSIMLHNDGNGELNIRAVELPARVVCSLKPGMRIAPGDALQVDLGIDPSCRDFGVASERIQVVTDDAKRPVLRVRVTANIID